MYLSHSSDHYFVSRKQREVMSMVHEVAKFMVRHGRKYIFVEGDKGKILGFLSRVEFAGLCDAFIQDAVRLGMFYFIF